MSRSSNFRWDYVKKSPCSFCGCVLFFFFLLNLNHTIKPAPPPPVSHTCIATKSLWERKCCNAKHIINCFFFCACFFKANFFFFFFEKVCVVLCFRYLVKKKKTRPLFCCWFFCPLFRSQTHTHTTYTYTPTVYSVHRLHTPSGFFHMRPKKSTHKHTKILTPARWPTIEQNEQLIWKKCISFSSSPSLSHTCFVCFFFSGYRVIKKKINRRWRDSHRLGIAHRAVAKCKKKKNTRGEFRTHNHKLPHTHTPLIYKQETGPVWRM